MSTAEQDAKPLSTIPAPLIQEIDQFRLSCCSRYRFNSRWDNILLLGGILASLSIVAGGALDKPRTVTILGGVVTALVAAQRAFPFSQRWPFYRILENQASNLLTDVNNGIITQQQAVTTLKSLRLDFAQEVPRGSDNNNPHTDEPEKPISS